MLPIDIQQKIQTYLAEVEDTFGAERNECFENKYLHNIEWYNLPNVQRFTGIRELFSLKSGLEQRLADEANEFLEYLRAICRSYAEDEFSPLYRLSREGDNPAFELLLKVVVVVLRIESVDEILSIFVPSQLFYDLSDVLEPENYSKTNVFGQFKYRESNIRIQILEKRSTEVDFVLRPSCPDANTISKLYLQSMRTLSSSVIVNQSIFDLNQIRSFNFVMHLNLYTALKAQYPAVQEKLYSRNSEWVVLREKILQIKYQQDNALRVKIRWLQERLRALGFRNTGNEIVGDQINPILAHFREYLDGFSDLIRERIYNTPVQPKSLFMITETIVNCTDTASDELDFLLAAPNYQALLSTAPDSKQSEEELIRQYTKEYRTAISIGTEPKVDVPDQHIDRAFESVMIHSADDFVLLLDNFPPQKFDAIFRTVNLRFITEHLFALERLPALTNLFRSIFRGGLIDLRSRTALALVMAKYSEKFGGINFLARLSIGIQHIELLNLLQPLISALDLTVREKILDANIDDVGVAFQILLSQPRMLESFLQCFTAGEFADYLLKMPQGSTLPRICDLVEYPAALRVILKGMDLPLKKLLMVETKVQLRPFIVTALIKNKIETVTIALKSFPEEQRLDVVNQSSILRIWATDNPKYFKRIMELLPAADREAAALFQSPFNPSLRTALCNWARNPTAIECMKIMLQLLPKHRIYHFLTDVDAIHGQSALHLVTAHPACIKMMFDELAPADRRAALNSLNRAGSTVESCIYNMKTKKYINQLLPQIQDPAIVSEESESPRTVLDWPFWGAKRPKIEVCPPPPHAAVKPSSPTGPVFPGK